MYNIPLPEVGFEFSDLKSRGSLARIIKKVIFTVLKLEKDNIYIDKEKSVKVHELLIQAKRKALGIPYGVKIKDMNKILLAKDEDGKDRDAKKEFHKVFRYSVSKF